MINDFFKTYIYYSNENISGAVYLGRLILSPVFLIFPPLFGIWVLSTHYKRAKALGISNSLICALISFIMLFALLFMFVAIFAPNYELLLSDKILLMLSFFPFLVFAFKNAKNTKEVSDEESPSDPVYDVESTSDTVVTYPDGHPLKK